MRSRLLLGLYAVLALGAGCEAMAAGSVPVSVPAPAAAAGYDDLVFSDEFSALDLSPDGGGTHRWYNGLWYRAPVERGNFTLQDGYVRATTDVLPLTVTSMAFLTTWPRKQGRTPRLFHYGYFEARLRFSPGRFNWPAFWLLSSARTKTGGEGGKGEWCEIDIFEGGRPHIFWGTVHHWKGDSSKTNDNAFMPLPQGADMTQWNTVGALWQPGRISWYFNGALMGSAPSPKVCDEQALFLIVGAQKRAYGPLPTSVDVDWVHVYR
ncbi:glycoside hydrolase family 16 protein [Sphingobium aquiterrae]|uniref:glycoside hydrolase family 16 protein n=1 Tax=Sphingobium aquiterrae TaxID=2038656 RepID=UPI003018E905